jgi:hypothetical protein
MNVTTEVYLPEDIQEANYLIEKIAVLSAEAIHHARKGRFDKKDFHLFEINNALSELRELHLKLDEKGMEVRNLF